MKSPILPGLILKQYQNWVANYEENNQRGRDAIMFAMGDQWQKDIVDARMISNKESLTFNLTMKYLMRMKAQSKQIEFSLNLCPINTQYGSDLEEANAYRMLLSSIVLDNRSLMKFSNLLDKCLDFGYSIVELNFKRVDDTTLCSEPDLRIHDDPSIAFFDPKAVTPCKNDGNYCGLRRMISETEFYNKFPEYKRRKVSWLSTKKNEVIDYWYRDYVPMDFYLLDNGIYKRQDLLSDEEKLKVIMNKKGDRNEETGQQLVKSEPVCKIYFMRICNNHVVEKPVIFPTDDLPIIYHYGLTTWTNDGHKTLPFIHSLKGAQKLHNYSGSQIAVAAKNLTADKWLFEPEHVQTQRAQIDAQQINVREGAFIFDKHPEGTPIRREAGSDIQQGLVAVYQQTKQEIDDLAGALLNGQTTSNTVVSGVALDKITHNFAFMNSPIIAAHIEIVNEIARLYRQMIPRLYTEERVIMVKKPDGTGMALMINQELATGAIKNNIKDINNKFHYEVKAGPSTDMQKENTLTALQEVYQIAPTIFNNTADIYFRCLNTPFADELARRVTPLIDPMLIKYSMGEIDDEEMQAYKKGMEDKQIQQQLEVAKVNPQNQQMLALADAEQKKAAAFQFKAITDRHVQFAKISNDQAKLYLEMEKLRNEHADKQQQLGMEELQRRIDENNQIINELINANQQPSGGSAY